MQSTRVVLGGSSEPTTPTDHRGASTRRSRGETRGAHARAVPTRTCYRRPCYREPRARPWDVAGGLKATLLAYVDAARFARAAEARGMHSSDFNASSPTTAMGSVEVARSPRARVPDLRASRDRRGGAGRRHVRRREGARLRSLVAFHEPEFVKIAWTLEVEPRDGGSRFRTETRAIGTDARARRWFRVYWSLVSPGVVLIRHALLPILKRDAERAVGPATRGTWAQAMRETPGSGLASRVLHRRA